MLLFMLSIIIIKIIIKYIVKKVYIAGATKFSYILNSLIFLGINLYAKSGSLTECEMLLLKSHNLSFTYFFSSTLFLSSINWCN